MAILSYALTTVQRSADYLGLGTIASGSTKETNLQLIINSVTAFIENYTNRRIIQTVYTNEMYDSDGSAMSLLLKNYPVDTSVAFTFDVRTSSQNKDSWETVDSNDYFVYGDSGMIKPTPGLVFLQGRKKYRVSYTAGYNFDNTNTFLGDTDAADLEYVVMKLIATGWNRRKSGPGIKSEKIGGYEVVYMDTVFESPEIKEILDKYRKSETASYQTPSNV